MNQQDNNQKVGQIERETQSKAVKVFRDKLCYDYLGNWEYREDNKNIEEQYLYNFLKKKGYSENIIKKSIDELKKVAENQQEDLLPLPAYRQ